jgi:hypothetical protein
LQVTPSFLRFKQLIITKKLVQAFLLNLTKEDIAKMTTQGIEKAQTVLKRFARINSSQLS